MDFTEKLLRLIAKHDCHDDFWWKFDPELKFFIRCNDVFAWGYSDVEGIETEKDLADLNQAYEDSRLFGAELYAARRRGMRPQGAFYYHFDEDLAALFDACGPYREVGFGNPYENIPGPNNPYAQRYK